MRLRSKLFYVFLAVLLVTASIVEASKRGKIHKKKNMKKGKNKKSALTTPSGSGGETPVERNSGPSLESRKTKDNKASVGEASSTVKDGRSEAVSSASTGYKKKNNVRKGKKGAISNTILDTSRSGRGARVQPATEPELETWTPMSSKTNIGESFQSPFPSSAKKSTNSDNQEGVMVSLADEPSPETRAKAQAFLDKLKA